MFPLTESVVHVWKAALDAAGPPSGFARMLDGEEKARAERFHFEHDRRHYVAARGWLRVLLGRYLDLPPGELRFGYGARGKPFLAGENGKMRFNLSHSHGRALFAFARGREVGVDLEAGERLGEGWQGLVRRVFSAREQAELAALPEGRQREAFLNGWTRKEAYLKATGLGITEGLQSIEVTLDPAQPSVLKHPADGETPTPSGGRAWSIYDLRTEARFAAALVVEGGGVTVERFDVEDFPAA